MVKMSGDKSDCGMHPPDMETLGALKDIYFTCCRCGDHLHVTETVADIKDKVVCVFCFYERSNTEGREDTINVPDPGEE
jgi:hypothetical protein